MVIWQGWGVLALLIPALAVFMSGALGGALLGAEAASMQHWVTAAGLILSAALVWVVGKKLNDAPGRVLVDPKTGQAVELKPRHTLFWIPMQWIAVAIVAVAAFVALK